MRRITAREATKANSMMPLSPKKTHPESNNAQHLNKAEGSCRYSAWNNNIQDWIMECTLKCTQRPEVSTLWCKVHEIWIEIPIQMYKYRGI